MKTAVLPLLLLASVACANEKERDFVRFVEDEKSGKLQTAVVRFENADGVKADLIGVVHIGDKAYYEALNKSFKAYDALLYEMVGGVSKGPITKEQMKSGKKDNPLRFFQILMQRMLELEFQLDQIDYSASNFVHADMDWKTFSKMREERGENLLKMLEKSYEHQQKLEKEGKGKQFDIAELTKVLYSDQSADEIKLVLGKQFQGVESMITGMEGDDDSVIIAERNKVAIGVLEKQMKKGRKNVGVFYGAGHLPGMAEILEEKGFKLKKIDWLTAWDVPKSAKEDAEEKPDEGAAKKAA